MGECHHLWPLRGVAQYSRTENGARAGVRTPQKKANWWEPGCAKTIIRGTARSLDPVYFRIQIVQITGHRGTPDSAEVIDAKSPTIEHADKQSIHNILGALRKRLFSK